MTWQPKFLEYRLFQKMLLGRGHWHKVAVFIVVVEPRCYLFDHRNIRNILRECVLSFELIVYNHYIIIVHL